MSDLNAKHNRLVWFDIPVADLARATRFYQAVLGIRIEKVETPGGNFAVLDHDHGNGGCLVEEAGAVTDKGILVYMNADGRLRDAVAQVEKHGGRVLQPVHAIGRHGFRAIILDCEGNRIALHSHLDM